MSGDRAELKANSDFGAKPYTEDEKKELSEIVKEFNDRHGTEFTEQDMIRFEQVNKEVLDGDMTDMLRNNRPDVVYVACSEAFLQSAIQMFQRDSEISQTCTTQARRTAGRCSLDGCLQGAQGKLILR